MQEFIEQYFQGQDIDSIESLPQAGSQRMYKRVWVNGKSYIVCSNDHVIENETFFEYTGFFRKLQLPVPELYHVSDDRTMYILEDLGTQCLLDLVIREGYTTKVNSLYRQAIQQLVHVQVKGAEMPRLKLPGATQFDKQAVLSDLQYFKYYFLDLQDVHYDKAALNAEFNRLSDRISGIHPKYFMFRDFQGRNIMVKEGVVSFIDYQGGMTGPLQYDVASLLWQAKAQLPLAWKQSLYQEYKNAVSKLISIDQSVFDPDYSLLVLIRLLQVLGAYGLRGIIQQKAHFISSIPSGLRNLQEWAATYNLDDYPILQEIIAQLGQESFMHRFDPMPADASKKSMTTSKLHIHVQSFSFKQGLPTDQYGNGGGFVFDCRGILNPGRFDAYKKLTGRDQAVIEFLESKTRVAEFLDHCKQLIAISIEDYMQRGFEHLEINFGCTGGQHRSVYCADAIAAHIQKSYPVKVSVSHVVQDAKNWVNG